MLYRKLELALYAIVVTVSVGVGVATERLDYRLQQQSLAASIAKTNQFFAFRLEAEIAQLVAWARGLQAAVALKPDLDQSEFSAAAARLGTDSSVILNISLATDSIVRFVFPFEPNSLLVGTDMRTIEYQSDGVELARKTAGPVFLGPVDLMQGGRGFILRSAFFPMAGDDGPSERWDMVSIVVNSEYLFENIQTESRNVNINTVISRTEDGTILFGSDATLQEGPVVSTLKTPSDSWQIASAPASGWPLLSSRAPTIAVIAFARMLIVFGVLRTIFKLVRRQKLAESQLSDAIEALDDGFALFDSDDRLVLSNRRYHEVYKTSGDLLVPGTTFEEILRGGVARGQYPDAVGHEEEWIKKRLRSHRLARTAIEQELNNGRWLRVVERKTKDGGTVGFRVDITELKQAMEAAKAGEQAKSDFISMLSHELRTPLTIILGYIGLIAKIGELPVVGELRKAIVVGSKPDAEKHLATLVDAVESMASKGHRSAHQLLSLINHLLDLSKIEAGKMTSDSMDLEVIAILHDIDLSFREVVEAKGLVFNVEGTSARVFGDPIKIRQILTNLLSNAVKFTEEGRISVEASMNQGRVRFQVKDTGCGIHSEIANRVFDPFEQGDRSSTRRAGGAGLGLAISKSLVELMGGEIGFDSTFQSGSTFWFTVPLAQD